MKRKGGKSVGSVDFIEELKKKVNSKEYGNSSIKKLKEEERVRKRPEALLGSNGLDGAKHTIVEIIGNATDERLSGYGDKLIVQRYEDGAISVRDFGRGVPLGWNEDEQEWNYHLIYEELYAGGKYEDENKQEILKAIDDADAWDSFNILDFIGMISIGLNGLGAAATQCSSSYCTVISYQNGVASRMDFKKGKHILEELEITDTDEENGTFIKWKPDDEIFKDTKISSKWLKKICKQLAYVSGFTTTFIDKGEVAGIWESRSLIDAMLEDVDNAVETSGFTHVVDTEGDICVCQAEVVIGSGGRGTEFFHNRVEVNGGSHSSAYNSALYSFFSDISGEVGVKIKDADYSGKFSILGSSLSNKMSVRGQTKDYLDDQFIFDCLYDCIYDCLKKEYAKGNDWLMKIIDEVVVNAQNRIAVAEMSKNLRDVERSIKRHKVSSKFASCDTYRKGDVEATEWFIVEGNSAGGRVLTARDSSYQCILPIRGKSLNVYKASIEKLVANLEIKDMIATLGCGIDLGIEGYESFDMSKLKVGKVMLLADADIDGDHIIMLLFLIFYRLFPELLYQGKVYIVETPLYVINLVDNTQVYCMDEEELKAKREEIGEHRINSVDRFKGLGETDADTLWETTLNPENRRIRQIKIERNDMELTDVLEVLFGKSTARRKQAILGTMMDNFDEVIEEMDNLSEYVEGLGLEESLEIEEVAY